MVETNWGDTGTNKEGTTTQNNNNGNIGLGSFDMLQSMLMNNSMTMDNRCQEVISGVTKRLDKYFEDRLKSTEGTNAKNLIPRVLTLDKNVSEVLPGICLSLTNPQSKVAYCTMFFFAEKALETTQEYIPLPEAGNAGYFGKQALRKLLPADYITKELITRFQNSIKANNTKDVKTVVINGVRLFDLDLYPKNENVGVVDERLIANLVNEIVDMYTNALLTIYSVDSTYALPNNRWKEGVSPFIDGKMYGNKDNAIATVEPFNGELINNLPSSANLMVKITTSSGKGMETYSLGNTEQKAVITAYCNVTLQAYKQSSFVIDQQKNLVAGNVNALQQEYFPLIPTTSLVHAVPGAQMRGNQGLHSFLMGIFAMLASNSSMAFIEPYRFEKVGARGSLLDIAGRAKAAINADNQATPLKFAAVEGITAAKLKDPEYRANWIRTHIAPHGMFGVEIDPFGFNNPIAILVALLSAKGQESLLSKEYGPYSYDNIVKTFINTIDSLCKGNFSKIVNDKENASGFTINKNNIWQPNDPIFIAQNVMIPYGIGREDNGKPFALGEVDEVMISRKGGGKPQMSELIALMNGRAPFDQKVRSYKITLLVRELFGTPESIKITGFTRRYTLASKFVETFLAAMNACGKLHVSGILGVNAFDTNIFADLSNLQTITSYAGSTGDLGADFNLSSLIF